MLRPAPTFVLLAALLLGCGLPPSVRAAESARAAPATTVIMLEAIGALGGAYSYHTHQELGYLAEAAMRNDAQSAQAQTHIQVVLSLTRVMDDYFSRMRKLALDEDDQKSLAGLHEVNALLAEQCRELTAFLQTRQGARFDQFQSQRAKTWALIARLLNLGDAGAVLEKKVNR